jgi:hypothetical protein
MIGGSQPAVLDQCPLHQLRGTCTSVNVRKSPFRTNKSGDPNAATGCKTTELHRPTPDLHGEPGEGNCAAKTANRITSDYTLMCKRRTRVKRYYCAVAGAAGATGAGA